VLSLPCAIFLFIFIRQVVFGRAVGSDPAPDRVVIFVLVVLVCLQVLFKKMTLTTYINAEGIYYKWSLLEHRFNKLKWTEVASAVVTQYRFVGFGIHFSRKYGIVQKAKGNKGLLIKLKKGSTRLIGTQKPLEIQEALDTYFKPAAL
jgi:hypothetical protein